MRVLVCVHMCVRVCVRVHESECASEHVLL